jgi:hypothetical protein
MAKGQKNLQDTATKRSAEQHQTGTQAAQRLQNNELVHQRRARVQKRRGMIDSGRIADAEDFISNRAAVAKRMEQRDMRSNLTSTGVAGLASNYADPTQIALADKANRDEFARDAAAEAEDDARRYMAETNQMESDQIATETGIDQSIMGNAWNSANQNMDTAARIAASRASILPSILGAAIQGGMAVATQGNWFNKASGGTAPGAPRQ